MSATTLQELQKLSADLRSRDASGKAYDDHVRKITKAVNSLKSTDIARLIDEGALDSLDPNFHTVLYLHLLCGYAYGLRQGTKGWPDELKPEAPLWTKITSFLVNCNRIEIRAFGRLWRELIYIILQSTRHLPLDSQPTVVLQRLAAALVHLNPTGDMLTSVHWDLIHLASATQCTDQILPLLDKDVSNIPTKNGAHIEGFRWFDEDCPACVFITSADGFSDRLELEQLQEYFILAALAYVRVQSWRRAIFLLEHVLATPVSGIANGLMVEAYNKWILINLIEFGHVRGSPKTVPQNVMKHIRNASKPYEALKDAYAQEDGAKLLAETIEGRDIWKVEGNVGLIQRVLSDHKRRSVMKLGQLYAAVPLRTVAQRLKMPELQVHSYLARLVNEGAIQARLEQPQTQGGPEILRFNQDSERDASTETEENLRKQLIDRTRRLKQLTDAVAVADQQLSVSAAFIEYTRKARKSKGRQTGAMLDQDGHLDIAPHATGSDDDEELMTDAP